MERIPMNQKNGHKSVQIRLIEKGDNAVVADIIRLVMTEFQAIGCGYSSSDSEVDDMHSAYADGDSAFFVVVLNSVVLGCGGFGPLTGTEGETCELRKMYFKCPNMLCNGGVGDVQFTSGFGKATKSCRCVKRPKRRK